MKSKEECLWVGSLQILHYFFKGHKHPQILVFMVYPKTNTLQITNNNCILLFCFVFSFKEVNIFFNSGTDRSTGFLPPIP